MKPTQLPSGAWRLRVFVGKDENGKRQFVSVTRNSKHECLRDAAEIAIHHHEVTRNSAMMTLQEAIDDYLEIKSNILSPSTIRGYNTIRRTALQPEMKMKLTAITSLVAQRAINREAKTKSPKTVANIFGLLSVVMRRYANKELVVDLPQKTKRRPNILTEEQVRALVMALQGHQAEVPILLALFLGLRRSEILGLRAEDYNPETKQLYVHRVMVQDKDNVFQEKNTTKTYTSTRTLTVPPYLAEKLEAIFKKSDHIWDFYPSVICKNLDAICKANNIPKMTLHDLRRQNASIMLSLGIADKYAMERGGWSTPSVMKNIYQYTMSDVRRSVDNTINQYFENVVTRKS